MIRLNAFLRTKFIIKLIYSGDFDLSIWLNPWSVHIGRFYKRSNTFLETELNLKLNNVNQ